MVLVPTQKERDKRMLAHEQNSYKEKETWEQDRLRCLSSSCYRNDHIGCPFPRDKVLPQKNGSSQVFMWDSKVHRALIPLFYSQHTHWYTQESWGPRSPHLKNEGIGKNPHCHTWQRDMSTTHTCQDAYGSPHLLPSPMHTITLSAHTLLGDLRKRTQDKSSH